MYDIDAEENRAMFMNQMGTFSSPNRRNKAPEVGGNLLYYLKTDKEEHGPAAFALY